MATATKAKAEPVEPVVKAGRVSKITPEVIAKILAMKDEGKSWFDISDKVGLNPSTVRVNYVKATFTGSKIPATPEAIAKARDEDKLSWDDVFVAAGLSNKGQAQKLYEQTGKRSGDSAIGKGGRFLPTNRTGTSNGAAPAPTPAKAPKATGAAAKANLHQTKPARGKIDIQAATDEELVAALTGKTITYKLSAQMGGGTAEVKVVRNLTAGVTGKSAKRTIKFADADNKNRAIMVGAITSYKR